MSLYSQLFLRETGSPYGDITRNSTLSFKDLDQNFIFLKERDISQLKIVGSDLIYETLGGTEYSVNIGGASTGSTGTTDTYVTGFTFNTGTNILTIKQNESQSDLTTNLSSLASDVYVLSGTYNPSTGDVTYVNSTGGTFVVSGFTTGITDTFVTGGTLTGTNLVLEKSNGVDTGTIDLSNFITDSSTDTLSNKSGNITQWTQNWEDVEIKGDGSTDAGKLRINCYNNNHYVDIKGPDHNGSPLSYSIELPNSIATETPYLTGGRVLESDSNGNLKWIDTPTGGGGGLNYISAGAVATNLETTSNWDINGVYTGATATGSQADCHVDSNYWFTCVSTDTWIRLIRG